MSELSPAEEPYQDVAARLRDLSNTPGGIRSLMDAEGALKEAEGGSKKAEQLERLLQDLDKGDIDDTTFQSIAERNGLC